MSDASLLPPNATPLERALAKAAAMPHRPEVIATLWNAQTCPAVLLPWLAWALSVDEWDDTWPEARQREAVQQSAALHRRKGTPWSVLRALEVHGYPGCELIEQQGYQQRWQAAGGLFMDGSWNLDGTPMAEHLTSQGGVLRGTVLHHWAQYAIRVNAAENVWSREAQRKIAATAKRYAPTRAHLVGLIGLIRWRHASPVHMHPARQRVRARFEHCQRLSSARLPVMDGCWLMDADKFAPVMDGQLPMDGNWAMAVHYSGPTMEGGHIHMRQVVRTKLQFAAGGLRTGRVRTMGPNTVRMDGRLAMDRHTMSGVWAMDGSQSMSMAQMDHIGLSRMDGTWDMGSDQHTRGISMRATATLRRGGQVYHEVLQ